MGKERTKRVSERCKKEGSDLKGDPHVAASGKLHQIARPRARDGSAWLLRADRLVEEIHHRLDTHRRR